jgi:hypothetical protein
MCITSASAKLSNTRILSMALDNGRHMLSYSNSATNLSGKKNSMILPIPGTLRKEWFYDTRGYNNFLKDIENRAYIGYDESHGIYSRGTLSFNSKSFDRFNLGIYDVLIANDIRNMVDRLGPTGPEISEELITFFENHYSGWYFLMCIFEGSEKMDSQPITFEYEPKHPNWLYFPTMDSHDGSAPNLSEKVKMEHSLMYEYPGLTDRIVNNMDFTQGVPEILKRRNYVSTKWDKEYLNGDMYMSLEILNKRTDSRSLCYDGFKRFSSHPEANLIVS